MQALVKIVPTTLVLLLGLGGVANAGRIFTPTFYQGSGQNVCIATNVSSTVRTVTVEIVGFSGAGNSATCTLAPGAPEGCQAFLNGAGYCRVTATGSAAEVRQFFRAVMLNRNITAPFTINASVEAR